MPSDRKLASVFAAALCLGAGCLMPAPARAQGRLLDNFDTLQGWQAFPSEGAKATLTSVPGEDGGHALRMAFDLSAAYGYAIARKDLPLDLPADYQFTFDLRAESPVNNLEFKLTDDAGNVWWQKRLNVTLPTTWTTMHFRKRDLTFAWGPSAKAGLHHIKSVEVVVSSGTGGKGWIEVDNLRLVPIDDAAIRHAHATITTSSAAPNGAPASNQIGTEITRWRAAEASGDQALTIDFGCERELGGLVLDWAPQHFASDYAILFSADGQHWRQAATVAGGNGGRDYVYLPGQETHWLRLLVHQTNDGGPVGLDRLSVAGPEFGADENTFFQHVAHDQRRGVYPRYFVPEQSYWTIVGSPQDVSNALVNTDGTIEVDQGRFTVEPFLYVDGKLVTWSDVTEKQSLEKDYLPIPSVEWKYHDLTLTTTVLAAGSAGPKSLLLARYRLENHGAPVKGRLFLAIRPFQVNPPWQSLQTRAGWAPIHEVRLDDGVIRVDDRTVVPLDAPAGFGATPFAAGEISEYLQHGRLPAATAAGDAQGFASAALAYDFNLARGAQRDVHVAVPFHGWSGQPSPDLAPAAAADFYAAAHNATRARWEALLDRFQVRLPASAQPVINTIKSNLAYIFINAEGTRIQPGSRNYKRSWIRDGALTSTALLELGLTEEPRAFADWYAPYQFPSGKIPCVVDGRGADPTDENDSNGEMIYLIMQVYRYTHDLAWLRGKWDTVVRTVHFIQQQRAQRETDAYLHGTPVQQACYGLVPESISHEGYSGHPEHSYWDDFFVLRGLKDATTIAGLLGEKGREAEFAGYRDSFVRDLYASIGRAMAIHHIDYIPGCVELGDFDPTSTTIALDPGGELARLPEPALHNTFNRYYQNFEARRDGTIAWKDFTPYENRVIGSFVRLGQKDRAQAVMDFMMQSRRPPAWNDWAEVVFRDPKTPRMIGDMPHTWCGSDFIRSVRTMFLYEREADHALVLGAGVADAWVLDPTGVTVDGLPSYYGPVNYSIRSHESSGKIEVTVKVDRLASTPGGGVILESPLARPIRSVTGDGQLTAPGTREIKLTRLPAVVTVIY